MNKTLKIVITTIVTVLVVGMIISSQKSIKQGNIIKIGVTAPLTGDLAFMGEGFKNSILLAQKDIEKNFGKTNHEYEIVFQDDSFDPVRGASAAHKLINTDKVNAIVSFGSSVGNAVSPIAEEAHVPHINAIASDPHVAIGDYNFVHWTPPVGEAKLLLEQFNKKGIKTAVIFEQNQAGVIAVTEAIRKYAGEYGVNVLATEKFNGDEKDFRTLIAEAKPMKADIYILEAMSPSLEILAKQLRDSGSKTPVTSIETFEYTEQMSMFEGDWYVYALDPTTVFTEDYKTTYGKNPQVGSPNGYDIVNFIVMASEKGDSIKEGLYSIQNYSGAVGKVSIDKDGMVVSEPTLRMIKDGKPITVLNK